MKTVILIDSGCSVSYEIIRRLHMKIMPFHITYPGRDYIDGVDILPEVVYQHSPGEISITSTPGPQDVKDTVEGIKVEGYTYALAFCTSSSLGGTYNAAVGVLGNGKDLTSFVLDTRDISSGVGTLAVWAGMQLEKGKNFNKLKEMLPGKVEDSKAFYYVDTLTHLRRGGRIGLVTSTAGSILNTKPIVSCNDGGVYYTAAKIRGAKWGPSRLLAEASSFVGGHPCLATLLDGQGQEVSDKLRPWLIARIPEGRLIMEKAITASLTVHTGPGLVRIGVLHL